MLGPWPILELVRSYLPILVSSEILLAVILLKRAKRAIRSVAARTVCACYLILTSLLVGSTCKALFTQRPQVEPELLVVMPQSFSHQINLNQSLGSNIPEHLNSFKAQVLVLVHSIQGDGNLVGPLPGYQSMISLPKLGLNLVFKGGAQVLNTQLSPLVQGLDARRSDEPKALAKSNGGLVKFQLAKQGSDTDASFSDGKSSLYGYLAFMRLPGGDTLENLRESRAYLRRLGALIRHLEGPIFILLDSQLSIFHKRIPYLEKVGRVKMASMTGYTPFILLPRRNLVIFKR